MKNKILLLILGVVLSAGVIVGLIFGVKALADRSPETSAAPETTAAPAATGSATEEDPALAAALTKEVYTVDDLTADDPRLEEIAAECGDYTLTVREAQIYYMMQLFDLLNQYGSYASSILGLDYTQPLSGQSSTVGSLSWEQYFLMAGLEEFQEYAAAAAEAKAKGYAIPDDERAQLDEHMTSIEEEAAAYGYDSADGYIQANFGAGVTFAEYKSYMELYFYAMSYENSLYMSIVPTEEDLRAYRDGHPEEFAELPDQPNVNVRHILFLTDTDEDGTVTDEERAAAQTKAQELLDGFLTDPSETYFAELANENSEDGGSNTNGGLYEDVYPGQMVEPFEAWCFDASRQPGDTGIVETSYGFHVMYYVGQTETYYWKEASEYYIRMEIMNDRVADILASAPLTAHYENIVLSPLPQDETE